MLGDQNDMKMSLDLKPSTESHSISVTGRFIMFRQPQENFRKQRRILFSVFCQQTITTCHQLALSSPFIARSHTTTPIPNQFRALWKLCNLQRWIFQWKTVRKRKKRKETGSKTRQLTKPHSQSIFRNNSLLSSQQVNCTRH